MSQDLESRPPGALFVSVTVCLKLNFLTSHGRKTMYFMSHFIRLTVRVSGNLTFSKRRVHGGMEIISDRLKSPSRSSLVHSGARHAGTGSHGAHGCSVSGDGPHCGQGRTLAPEVSLGPRLPEVRRLRLGAQLTGQSARGGNAFHGAPSQGPVAAPQRPGVPPSETQNTPACGDLKHPDLLSLVRPDHGGVHSSLGDSTEQPA